MFIIYQVHLSSNKGYHEALKKKSMAPILYDDTSLHVIRWRFWRQFNDPDNGLAERLWMNDDDDDGHDWMKWRPPPPPGGFGPSLVNGRRPLLRQKLSLPPISTSLLADTKRPPQVPWRCHPRFHLPSKTISCLDTSFSVTRIITAGQSKTILSSHFYLPQRYLQQNRSL